MKKRIYFDLLVIFLLGLLPLLWLPGKLLLFGHDAGIPFDPITHFLDRFSVWSQRLGIGTDQSFGLLGALPIHGLEAFLSWIGFSIKAEQLTQFVFWFMLPGLAMYFLSYKIWPNKKYLPLFAAVVYMVNFYLLQAWFVAERTKLSIYVATPIVVYFSIFYLQKKISWKRTVIGTGLIFSVFNGGGSIPLYGGLFIFWGMIAIYWNFINFSFRSIFKTIAYFGGIGILYILLNAYWIFSYVYYILGFYSRDLALAGGSQGALAWASYLSKGSTLINMFRGQGIPEWYLNPYHAYASSYLHNPLLILISFTLPVIAYSSLFLIKDKKDKFFIYFFALLSLITLIFAGGPGTQLGIVYELMTRYIPGFAIFRSAFYKFDYTFWLAYGILIGFALDRLFSYVEKKLSKINIFFNKAITVWLLVILIIIGYLFYHYPFLTGSFLDYSREPGKELSTRISVPQYVFDFGKWSNEQDFTKRYLVVPELSETGFVSYQWGYWSYAPISSLQTKSSFVQNTFLLPENERFLTLQMYRALLNGDVKSFSDLVKVFAIDGIVLHEDFDWKNIYWGTTNPQIYRKILESNPIFKLQKVFGKWRIYDIVKADKEKSLRVTATSRLSFLQGELKNVASFPYFDSKSPLFMANLNPSDANYYASQATDVYVAPECIACDLRQEDFGFRYYNPKVLPGSVLYPLVLFRENKIKKNAKDFNSLLNYYLTASDRRIVEGKWMVDSKSKIEFLNIAFGNYYDALVALRKLITSEWGISGKEENKAAQTINAHILQQVSLIDSIYENDLLNIEHRRTLAKSYEEILIIKKEADRKQWLTQDINDKRYIFDLPKTGVYEIYVKKRSLANPNNDASSSLITLGDTSTTLKPIGEVNDWISFGKINLEQSKLKLALRDGTLKNLIDEAKVEFPDGIAGISVNDKIYSMNLESRNKCIAFTVDNLETVGTAYLVSFNYRNLTDKKDLGFFLSQEQENFPRLHVRESFVANSRAWANHIQPFIPKYDSIKLNFCNGFVSISQKESIKEKKELELLSPGQNLMEVRDISLFKISFPNIVLYQKQSQVSEENYVLDSQKVSSVEYKIKMKPTNKPVTLIMRENYGRYWQFCEKGKKCLSFDDKTHFASAGFTNGWYLKNGVSGDIDLYYYPQKTYTVGVYTTLTALFIILGGICWKVLRRKQ